MIIIFYKYNVVVME